MVNVQALIARDPAAFRRLKRVVAMGGSINVGYDPGGPPAGGPSAEYNVAAAPAALASVLDAGRPVTLFPLDSTKVAFDAPARERLFAQGSGATGALAALYGEWRTNNAWGQVTPSLFDVVPVAWLIDPGLCSPTPMRIAVDAKGFTRPEIGGPNASVCLTAQPERVRRLVLETLAPTSGPTATKAP
jgi:inosine-uridine nucleoside N-ribohydrolase